LNQRTTILDTNVLSELLRPQGDAKVRAFVERLDDPLVSSIVFHELAYGVEMMAAGSKRARLSAGIEIFRNHYRSRTVPVDVEIAEIAGRLRAGEARSGFKLDAPDALIAATAVTRSARLATRNIGHFERLSIELVDPWNT
jgi:predicted nucleic acid-binding protein